MEFDNGRILFLGDSWKPVEWQHIKFVKISLRVINEGKDFIECNEKLISKGESKKMDIVKAWLTRKTIKFGLNHKVILENSKSISFSINKFNTIGLN